ncbi:MAG TPA: fluoride efflux transporter CrcB [Puia sp.]|nr:fluoride efflux transporter CrcB [Puia sp.]
MMLKNVLIVGIGGGMGSIARYLCQKYFYQLHPHPFPFGTFIVNIFGCFLIGIFYALSEKGNLFTPEWRIFLTTGICGGFTTFSSFAYENVTLLRASDYLYFGLYAAGSVALGIIAAFCGIALLKLL